MSVEPIDNRLAHAADGGKGKEPAKASKLDLTGELQMVSIPFMSSSKISPLNLYFFIKYIYVF